MPCHATSVLKSFLIAASSRRSTLPRSASPLVNQTIDSIANVCDAIQAIFAATASCLPIGRPHCTRSFAHSRAISSMRRPPAAQPAGIVRRPVVSVISASFRPRASPPEEVFFGNVDVLEAEQRVADAAQAHELAAVLDLEPRRVRLDDERRDLFLL